MVKTSTLLWSSITLLGKSTQCTSHLMGVTPYKRTLPSTMEKMKMLAGEKGPVATCEAIDK